MGYKSSIRLSNSGFSAAKCNAVKPLLVVAFKSGSFAINLLTENVDLNIDIIGNKASIDAIMKKIGLVYKDVKKNEITLGDDYLFHGLEKTNLDKTIERLEKMNEIFSK